MLDYYNSDIKIDESKPCMKCKHYFLFEQDFSACSKKVPPFYRGVEHLIKDSTKDSCSLYEEAAIAKTLGE